MAPITGFTGTSQLQLPSWRRSQRDGYPGSPPLLHVPCTPIKGWRPTAATVVHGPAQPLGMAGLRVHVPPGRLRHGAAAGGGARRAGKLRREDGHVGAAPSVTSHMHSTCARAPFSVSSGSIGASRTPNETSRGAARAHVEDAGRPELLLRRVQVKAALLEECSSRPRGRLRWAFSAGSFCTGRPAASIRSSTSSGSMRRDRLHRF